MLRGGLVKSCGCMHSYGEEKIALCFTKMGVLYERQKTFEDCRNPKTGFLLYFDFLSSCFMRLILVRSFQSETSPSS